MILAAGAASPPGGWPWASWCVGALREATLSTHQRVDPDSQTELVVSAGDRAPRPASPWSRSSKPRSAPAAWRSTPTWSARSPPRATAEFRAVLRPSMDETNRRQFRGCLEDWLIDHVRLDVVTLHDLGPRVVRPTTVRPTPS